MRRRIIGGSAARRLATAAVLTLGVAAVTVSAEAADVRRQTRLVGVGPCADEGVLASIRHRFAYGAARVEKRDLGIVQVDRIRETYATVDRPSPIPRRYCSAAVTLSDGSRSTLSWVVAGGAGFAAPGFAYVPDEIEFCVAGHDPWRVHDGGCRTTRKFW